MKRVNIIAAAVVLLVCIGYFIMIQGLPDRNLDNTLKSSFMPTLLLLILVILSITLLIKNIVTDSEETCNYLISKRELLGLVAITGLIFAYIFLLDVTGFLLITPVIMFVLMRLTGGGKIRESIIVSVSATLIIYLLFDLLFQVQLPDGLIF
ncbi:MAG: tripartite tricarboxylate transporter TctB family protein [Spirochaetales bacterium]|uniref:Tripartite tricarboxylate transporter TctB family protein n=1 Tax=Candidatus Thalassospirochaeta sargassi TaxID=3119039 RepID=A0AAJ1IIE9_9SPIO|nr:tripartite tricarboxylate transporter TctB family protein [Spirochaetales bacterium]